MPGTRSEGRSWLGRAFVRPKLSISFALVTFLAMIVAAKVATPRAPATSVIEIQPESLHQQIAALDGNLVPEPTTIEREVERLRSAEMAGAVLDRLPEEEIAAILAGNVFLVPIWFSQWLVGPCAREDLLGGMVRPVCSLLSLDARPASAALPDTRDALSVVGDPEHGRISISFSIADPDRAAAMANLYAETYVQQRLEDKQRLRDEVRRAVLLARMTHPARSPGDTGETSAQLASDALQDPGAEPARVAGPPAPSPVPDGSAGAKAESRAVPDDYAAFLNQTQSLLTDPAWKEPPAVVVASASPPVRSSSPSDGFAGALGSLPAGGLAVAFGGLVSLLLGIAFGTLVDTVWPARERRPGFYENPYWPRSGADVTPSRPRMLINAEPGTQLIPSKGSTTPSTSASGGGMTTDKEVAGAPRGSGRCSAVAGSASSWQDGSR